MSELENKVDGAEISMSELLASQRDRVQSLEPRNAVLTEALENLVFVKDHKEKHGKDKMYLELQPLAWEAARKALAEEG